ncbi:MAG: beta-N-acetylhexosaminidase [Paraglaciecola sp.]|uniref:beta-N-acetylhexosaminidase n=1 Tax=Paraglaciecola sp. TaxID=1920173 RepID=UPI00273FFB0F|nr:beta-N-acetylhexosaminidase [Paraglaciecola sp.]MDP5030816.1 beta-N-acetylhexosaminidase [Paraglaciecola sp.]MDP5129559.1 beta-N-acetylhexosaminidase [Paraglaciecola sp.]
MGPLMIDVSGYELTHEEIEMLDHPLIGGLILFSRNFYDQAQLSDLIKHIRQSCRNDIIIAVDHEGGRVQRFRQGFSLIPAMGKLFPLNSDREPVSIEQSNRWAEQFGWLMAAELLAFDIDISFAPVLDINGNSQVIGDRSFHQQPQHIVRLASEFIRGMHRAGMKATGKHFPGHGNVLEDSHIAMPVDRRSREEIMRIDMQIFKDIHQQGLLSAVMPAHVIYPEVDALPAGFSKTWIGQILRQELAFDGVVFSDDLSMQGAKQVGDIITRVESALAAGCDMALVCNDPASAMAAIDGLPSNLVVSERPASLKKSLSMSFKQLKQTDAFQNAQRSLEQFNELMTR